MAELPEPKRVKPSEYDGYAPPEHGNAAEYWAEGYNEALEVMRAYARAAIQAERERCAKLCESMMDPQDDGWDSCLREVAAFIRGQAEGRE